MLQALFGTGDKDKRDEPDWQTVKPGLMSKMLSSIKKH